jgi:putative ABC transport system permease protein
LKCLSSPKGERVSVRAGIGTVKGEGMIKLKNVSKFYYSNGMITSGFSKVSIELNQGEFVVITGESGSGKTTLLNVLSGLDGYDEGEMYIDGKETSHYSAAEFEEYRKVYIGNIFQSFNLINSYTVYQNIELPLLVNGSRKKDIKEKVLSIIEKVGLQEQTNSKCSKLSGGQKQRVAIARALAKETPIIVADEPTGNLDSTSAKGVVDLLKEISADKLVVVVTHNAEQFAGHATRIVKMSDGKIVEDRPVKAFQKIEMDHNLKSKKITPSSSLRLGIRNAFNIVSKLLLLLLVFVFVSLSTTSAYTGFKNQDEEQNRYGYNQFFQNFSDDRIVVKKADNSAMTEADFKKLEALENVGYIQKNDVITDSNLYIESQKAYVNGFPKSAASFSGTVDYGRLPKEKNEVLVVGNTDDMFQGNDPKSLLDLEYTMYSNSGGKTFTVKIVGIKNKDYTNGFIVSEIYLAEDLMREITEATYRDYSKLNVTINDRTVDGNYEYRIMPNDKVPQGEAYVPEEVNSFYKNGNSLNRIITIEAKNIYFKSSLQPKITARFNKNNILRLTGFEKYEEHSMEIFINPDDFSAIFEQGSFQSSIYVTDLKKVDETAKVIEDLGYKTLVLKHYLQDFGGQEITQIVQIPLLIIFMVGVFFVAYFVTRLILKSRGVYFTILRILGLDKENTKRILDIELFTVVTIAYGLVLGLFVLVSQSIIKVEYVKSLIQYLTASDYIILYAVLLFMAFLLSRRFARRLFKKSAMVTFREEA